MKINAHEKKFSNPSSPHFIRKDLKRAYLPPKLIEYGSVNMLTNSTAGGMVTDGGGMGKSGAATS